MLNWKRPLFAFLMVGLLAIALHGAPAQAQTTWHAEYYNNRNLSGTPVLDRNEDKIFYDWGDGSPDDAVNVDDFSATWNGNIYLDKSTVWRFVATTDDGMRVFIDNNPIIDVWYDSQAHTVTTDIYLASGTYPVRVEYYEAGGGAVAQFSWYPATTINNWRGEYFNNRSLTNQPVLIRDDATINFEWGTGSPAPGTVNSDDFSARWTRTLQFDAGSYRFSLTTDDGARLWVNNQLVIDAWFDQTVTTYTADVFVPSGSIPIKMEYYDKQDNATARLSWTAVSGTAVQPSTLTPATVNWDAAYYNNYSLDGSPVMMRVDPEIRFTWGSSSPQPNVVNDENFSVRWLQDISFGAGTTTFKTTVEGGVRLYVNGQLVIDQWQPEYKVVESTVNVNLPGGPVPVQMEFHKNKGLAQAWLDWYPAGSAAGSVSSSSAGSSTSVAPPELSGNTAAMTGARHLTVREAPEQNATAVAYLSRDEVVTLLARDPFTIWVQVRLSDGTEGWVSGRFLTANIPLDSLPINYDS